LVSGGLVVLGQPLRVLLGGRVRVGAALGIGLGTLSSWGPSAIGLSWSSARRESVHRRHSAPLGYWRVLRGDLGAQVVTRWAQCIGGLAGLTPSSASSCTRHLWHLGAQRVWCRVGVFVWCRVGGRSYWCRLRLSASAFTCGALGAGFGIGALLASGGLVALRALGTDSMRRGSSASWRQGGIERSASGIRRGCYGRWVRACGPLRPLLGRRRAGASQCLRADSSLRSSACWSSLALLRLRALRLVSCIGAPRQRSPSRGLGVRVLLLRALFASSSAFVFGAPSFPALGASVLGRGFGMGASGHWRDGA
jgi:hypothetical protein